MLIPQWSPFYGKKQRIAFAAHPGEKNLAFKGREVCDAIELAGDHSDPDRLDGGANMEGHPSFSKRLLDSVGELCALDEHADANNHAGDAFKEAIATVKTEQASFAHGTKSLLEGWDLKFELFVKQKNWAGPFTLATE